MRDVGPLVVTKRRDAVPSTRATVAAVVAAYVADGSWLDLGRVMTDARQALRRSPNRIVATLSATKSAFRWDVHELTSRRPLLSVIRLGAEPLLIVDHHARTYHVLQRLADDDSAAATELVGEDTPFGPTLRLTVPFLAGGEARVRLVTTPVLPSLESWWPLCVPVRVPRSHRRRLLSECEVWIPGRPRAVARLTLRSLGHTTVPLSLFRPPRGFTLASPDRPSRTVTVPRPPAPTPTPGLTRESAIAALLGSANDERLKLQLRNEVADRVAAAVNGLSTRLGVVRGSGFQLDLGSLLSDLAAPGPMTPPGGAAIAHRLLLRALFFHWTSQMRRILESDALRERLWTVVDALKSSDASAGSVEAPATTPAEDRALFRSMRDLIVRRREDGTIDLTLPNPFVSLLDVVRNSDFTPAETLGVLTLQAWSDDADQIRVAHAWFDREFRHVSLQPPTGFTQSGGQNRGWRKNGYLAEGLAQLIDLELEVDSVDIDVGGLAMVGPTAPIDETDPRFRTIDAVDPNAMPGTRRRAGFVTTLRLNSIEISGNLITTPARTPVVAALALLAPHDVLRLWSHTDGTVDVRGVSADLIVYLEQERLSPAAPALKAWVSNIRATSHDVTGTFLSPSLLLTAVINPIVNELLDHVTPAVIDSVRRRFFAALDGFLAFVENGVASLFDVTLPPRPARMPSSVEAAIQEAATKGLTLRDDVRLQPLLNLNREELFGLRTGEVNARQNDWNAAFVQLDQLWQAHSAAAAEAGVSLTDTGFNPRGRTRPITNAAGQPLAADQIDALQATYDAWAAQLPVVAEIESRLGAARERLDELLTNWPEGTTACEVVNEISGWRVGLGLCRLGRGRALVHPPIGVSQTGDLTLLLSAGAFAEMTAGSAAGYRGDVRVVTDGSPAVLAQLPALDWWQHAEEPGLLGARPTDLRDGPPLLPPGPSSGDIPDWRSYWSVIDIARSAARLVPVHNPPPGTPVAELVVAVAVSAGVTTYTAVNMEVCGPDLTRLAGELEQPPLGDPGRFRPPAGPGGPRPRPDQPATADVEVGVHRVPNGLEPTIVTASALEHARVRFAGGDDPRGVLDIEGALFARPGRFGTPGDAHCRVITAWDVRSREEWLNARLELRFPVFLGFANTGPTDAVRLPGENLIGVRARLPILTYRFAAEPVATGPFTLQTAGPLAGLDQGQNRPWLEALLANHARALFGNSPDPHRLRPDNLLRYAYGVRTRLALDPEGFEPYAILAMHPSHWSGAAPIDLADANPPSLRLETFGSGPDALNLAVNLFLVESVLDKTTL